jgi:hypothetical protein
MVVDPYRLRRNSPAKKAHCIPAAQYRFQFWRQGYLRSFIFAAQNAAQQKAQQMQHFSGRIG